MSAVLWTSEFCLGLDFCTQAGLFWPDLVEHFITTCALVLVAICESLLVVWTFTAGKLRTHLDVHRSRHFECAFNTVMRLSITTLLLLT